MNDRPWRFLDQDDVKVCLSLEDSVDDEMVFPHVLGKDFEILQNHIFYLSLSKEQIDLNLLSWISAYFLRCHSLLKQCLQNGH